MTLGRLFFTVFTTLVLFACKHPIHIQGEGDVHSASGTRDCALEDFQAGLVNCSENNVDGDYVETYTGIARSGFQFRRWANYCAAALTNECRFNVPTTIVQSFSGLTVPPLKAVFRPTVNTGFTSLFMGQSIMVPIAAGLQSHASNAGYTDHTTTIFSGPGALGTPQAFWDDLAQREAIKAQLDSGEVELFGMSYGSASATLASYRQWIDYALSKNADTRFFIAVPWSADPASVTSGQYEANFSATETGVHALIDTLRSKYPGVDFYAVPYGQSAVELYTLYDNGNLGDVSALVGASADAVFQDDLGNPGDILVALSQLVWLGAIYAVDLSTYDYDPGYSADLVSLAGSIIDEHDSQYHAPPEVDSDTDGDGIVDRLDPNPTGRPNILVMMVDDLGFNDLAINNDNANIDTPNMDQLARDGVRFTRHYAAGVCSPARAAFLTGLYPERVGYLPNGRGISPGIVTLPERLKGEGYTTWHIGKWHIGDLQRTAWPDHQGFDHWFGFLNQWRLAGLHVDGALTLTTPRYTNPWLEGDTEPGRNVTGHLENILTDKAIEVLSGLHTAQAPWFLNLWFYAPHSPIQPAAEFAALYPDTNAGRYQALVNQLDTNIGRVISHLESIGALRDTIVVVVSDNGGTSTYVDSNTPYFGNKATVTEGALRTPLIIRWTEESVNGQVIDDIVEIKDIYPSLLEAIGVSPSANLDGESFYRSAQQLEIPDAKDRFWQLRESEYGVLSADGRWRLRQPPPVWGIEFAPRIYDLELDPSATEEVLPIPMAQLTQMRGDYYAWYREVHTVQTDFHQGEYGGGTLTGMDLMRTPGFFNYTFGIGISDSYEGQIAGQEDIWSISRTGETVTANYGGHILAGDIVAEGSCHSIVVSGNFQRKVSASSGPDHITLALFIDGVESHSISAEDALVVPDPAIATIIGDPENPAQYGELTAPVILNTQVNALYSPWTVESFGQELCSTL